jgi:hypothetical protein
LIQRTKGDIMIKLNRQLGLAMALATALLVGCGGGGSGGVVGQVGATTDLSAAGVFTYISNLINGTSENAELVDVNALTLAGDDTAQPTPLP